MDRSVEGFRGFDVPAESVVVTGVYVTKEKMPILLAIHGTDGSGEIT